MDALLHWLTGLPPVALYAALALAAAIENIFPPVPADTVVAFGAFLAAQGEATPVGTFLATWVGNVGGAMLVFFVARRLGSDWLSRRLERFGGPERREKLEAMYRKRGPIGLFLSRFLPGVRALVPPVAGVLQIPALSTAAIMAVASGIWYGAITFLAYRLGASWEELQARIGSLSMWAAIVAGALVLIGGIVWFVRRRRGAAG